MHDGSHNNAMTEIALALAMAFFSIMVLTMVSMGAGHSAPSVAVDSASVPTADQMSIAPSDRAEPGQGALTQTTQPTRRDTVIIHYQGRFLDTELQPVDPAAFAGSRSGPLVVAIAPTLTLQEAMSVRAQVSATEVTVTTLDQRWLTSLKERIQ